MHGGDPVKHPYCRPRGPALPLRQSAKYGVDLHAYRAASQRQIARHFGA